MGSITLRSTGSSLTVTGSAFTFGSLFPQVPASSWNRFGFAADSLRGAFPQSRAGLIIFPYWFAALVLGLPTLLLSVMSFRANRAHRRILRGCCVACGYDLRASPQRCPECGRAVAAG